MKTYVWPAQSINTAGLATEAKQDVIIAEIQDFHTDNSAENAAQLAETQDFHADNTAENAALLAEVQDFHADNTTENTGIQTAVSTLDTNNTSQNASQLAQLQGVNSKLAATFFKLPYDTLQVVTKTTNGPTQIVSKTGGLAGTIVQTLNIVYDIDGDFQSGVVS